MEKREPIGLHLRKDDARNEEARYDKENIYPNEPTRQSAGERVIKHNGSYGDGPKAIDIWTISEIFHSLAQPPLERRHNPADGHRQGRGVSWLPDAAYVKWFNTTKGYKAIEFSKFEIQTGGTLGRFREEEAASLPYVRSISVLSRPCKGLHDRQFARSIRPFCRRFGWRSEPVRSTNRALEAPGRRRHLRHVARSRSAGNRSS